MTAQAIGAAAGALGGLGAVLLLAWLSSLRAPRLDDRLAPYLSDAAGSRLLPVDPVPRGPLADLLRLFAPWAGEVLGRVLGNHLIGDFADDSGGLVKSRLPK